MRAMVVREYGTAPALCEVADPAGPARECSDAFARLAEHAAAGDLTVEYHQTGLEALPAIWADFAAGRAQTKIIVTPNEVTPS
jgi:hypothetical protein